MTTTITIKQETINIINKVLRSHKKFYISTDFPFIQLTGFYLNYRAKIMNTYLQEKGYTMVRAKDVNLKRTDVNVRGSRNIWLKTENFINYKK
jgi:hypothetical protein